MNYIFILPIRDQLSRLTDKIKLIFLKTCLTHVLLLNLYDTILHNHTSSPQLDNTW